jgi:hypothetical protein
MCSSLAARGRDALWVGCDGRIRRAANGKVQTLGTVEAAEGVAFVGDHAVVVVGLGYGMVRAVPLGGGKLKTVMSGLVYPTAMLADAADPGRVYVLDDSFDTPGRVGWFRL